MPIANWIDFPKSDLPAWLKEANTPGAAVALLRRGAPPELICAGVKDLDSQVPVTSTTIFEAASLGKPIFACLTLILANEDLLDLDTPVATMLPVPWASEDQRFSFITPRQVLRHASGLPNWFKNEGPFELRFDPGTRFGYSGEGYFYLQKAIEQITGLSLEELARQKVFKPLGMDHSSFTFPESLASLVAQGHDSAGKPLPKWKPAANAGASLHTTLADYARFIQAMLKPGEGIPLDVVNVMLTASTPIDNNTAWGLGWGQKVIGGPVFWQWGDNTGWKHLAVGSQAQGSGVLVLTNGEHGYHVWKRVLHETIDSRDEIFTFLENLA